MPADEASTSASSLSVLFWGVRGSVACPGPATLRYGGNTPCVEVRCGPHTLIFDAGTGIRQLGNALVKARNTNDFDIFLSHGHIDHMWSVLPVCSGYDIPAWIHPDDRALLTDPYAASWAGTREQVTAIMGPVEFGEPDDVRELGDGAQVQIAGMTFTADHAPGHTRGSVAFRLMPMGTEPLMLSGDLLFAGSVGRTDLPGGDAASMRRSLERVVLSQPDEMVVLPGHGQTTTIGTERRTNPFLQELSRPGGAW